MTFERVGDAVATAGTYAGGARARIEAEGYTVSKIVHVDPSSGLITLGVVIQTMFSSEGAGSPMKSQGAEQRCQATQKTGGYLRSFYGLSYGPISGEDYEAFLAQVEEYAFRKWNSQPETAPPDRHGTQIGPTYGYELEPYDDLVFT